MSYVFSFTFFSLPPIFTLHWWPLAFPIWSPPLQNFHVVLPTKKISPLFFIFRSRPLSPFFSLSFAGLPLSLFLCLSPALYFKFADMTINVILKKTRLQKQFPLSVFVFIDSLVYLCFIRRRRLCDFPPK